MGKRSSFLLPILWTCVYYMFSNGIDILSWTAFGYILNGEYQFLATLVGLFVTVFVVFKISKITLSRFFSFDSSLRLVGFVIVLGFAFRIILDPILNIDVLFNDSLSDGATSAKWSYIKQFTYLFQYVLLYPLAEEAFFRFYFFKRLRHQYNNERLFVLLSASCFALIHINPLKEFYFTQVLIPLLFGLLSANLFVRLRSVQLAVLLHSSYNLAHYLFMLNWVENGDILYSKKYAIFYLTLILFCFFAFLFLITRLKNASFQKN